MDTVTESSRIAFYAVLFLTQHEVERCASDGDLEALVDAKLRNVKACVLDLYRRSR